VFAQPGRASTACASLHARRRTTVDAACRRGGDVVAGRRGPCASRRQQSG
jgi:hypothetical protein